MTANDTGDLNFWDVQGRKHQEVLPGVAIKPTFRIQGSARFLPGGDLVFVTAGRGISFLDASGRPSARPPIERGGTRAVKLEVDRQGRSLAVGWEDGRIDLFDPGTGALRRSFAWDKFDFALGPDGRWLAVQTSDGRLQLLSTDGQGSPITLGDRRGYYAALAFSPDGTTLASVADHSLMLWDLASARERMSLGGHKESITGIAFSPDGALVATTCNDQMTRIWDARDGRALAVLPGPGWMSAPAFSPDGNYLAASALGSVCLYQLKGRREQRRLVGHKFGVQCLAFHPRSPRFASGSDDHDVIVWDADESRLLRQWTAHKIFVAGLAYSPDGSLLASTRGDGGGNEDDDCSIHLWDAENGTLRKRLPRPGAPQGIRTLAFDPSGRRLASGNKDGTVLLWDVDGGQILRYEKLESFEVLSAVFVDGGRHLVVGQMNGTVTLFDLEGSSPARQTRLPYGFGRLAADARGNRLIVGDARGGVTALALPDLTVVRRLAGGHEGEILAVALSPDGQLLATGGRDRQVVLRDARTFEPWLTFPASTGAVRDLAFDASGRWLAIAGTESDVGLWDVGMVRDELAALGLAWDQPAPAVISAENLAAVVEASRIAVPVIRPGRTDPVEFDRAKKLVKSGVGAFEQGRPDEAIRDLQAARDRLRTMHQAVPGDGPVAGQLGISLGFLGSALRGEHRPAEALEARQEARRVLESIREPTSLDFYNLACTYANLATLVAPGPAPPTSAGREALADRAVEALRRSLAAGGRNFALIDRDPVLDPLRGRADFRALMLDGRFPRDPFAAPSPIGPRLSLKEPERQELTRLDRQIAGQPGNSDGWIARANVFGRRCLWVRRAPGHPPGAPAFPARHMDGDQ